MIRDKNGILAEVNDPDTVLSSSTLESDMLVVGAGNKGIKAYEGLAQSILTTNTDGIVESFEYSTPNRCVGTDSDGNLTMLNIQGDMLAVDSNTIVNNSDDKIETRGMTDGDGNYLTYDQIYAAMTIRRYS